MQCVNCHAEMTVVTLPGHMGRKVDIDLCRSCELLWFDRMENVSLTPQGTLQLFRAMHAERGPSQSVGEPLPCPRCSTTLKKTFNMQRATRFSYLGCPERHGHLISFFEFLREKEFVKALSPEKLAELRTHVKQIQCSACGAPIDLEKTANCTHCGAAVSFLDPEQVQKMLDTLQTRADKQDRAPDAAQQAVLALDLHADRIRTERLFQRMEQTHQVSWGRHGLLEVALGALFEAF